MNPKSEWVVDELIEDALRELADEAYQRQLWLASTGPEVSSLTECMSRLWDDSGLSSALESRVEVYNRGSTTISANWT